MQPGAAVLVASTDRYADLWEPFFTLFRRYWPDCPYPVYLGSNERTFPAPDVRAITVGEDIDWSTGFAEMVGRVEEPYALVLLEDYLLTQRVDTARIERLFGHMRSRGAACLRLMPVPGAPDPDPELPEVGELPRGAAYRVSLQAAIWERETLLGLLRPGESAWELETAGSRRSDELAAPFLSIVRGGPRPLPYLISAVRKGRWQRDALKLCRRERVPVDLTLRPQESLRAYGHRKWRWYRQALGEQAARLVRRWPRRS